MIIRTQTGSVYCINKEDKKVARLHGIAPPTDRQGKDGEWREYSDISVPAVGEGLLIVWAFIDGGMQTTLTSTIVSIESGEEIDSGWSN